METCTSLKVKCTIHCYSQTSSTACTIRYSSQSALRLFQSQINQTMLQSFALQKQTTITNTAAPCQPCKLPSRGPGFGTSSASYSHNIFLLHVEKMSRICSDSTGAPVCLLINPKQLHSSQLSHLPSLTKAVDYIYQYFINNFLVNCICWENKSFPNPWGFLAVHQSCVQ